MNNERGFTLTELLVACAIIGMVMAGIFTLQQQGQSAYLWGSARVEVQQNARLALDLMTRELRSATSITAVGGNCNSSGATTITFVDSGSNAVVYNLTGTTLQRNAIDVIAGVETFGIFCYQADGYTGTTTVGDIRSIRVQIGTRTEANPAAGQAGAQHAIVESRVKLRNL